MFVLSKITNIELENFASDPEISIIDFKYEGFPFYLKSAPDRNILHHSFNIGDCPLCQLNNVALLPITPCKLEPSIFQEIEKYLTQKTRLRKIFNK